MNVDGSGYIRVRALPSCVEDFESLGKQASGTLLSHEELVAAYGGSVALLPIGDLPMRTA